MCCNSCFTSDVVSLGSTETPKLAVLICPPKLAFLFRIVSKLVLVLVFYDLSFIGHPTVWAWVSDIVLLQLFRSKVVKLLVQPKL